MIARELTIFLSPDLAGFGQCAHRPGVKTVDPRSRIQLVIKLVKLSCDRCDLILDHFLCLVLAWHDHDVSFVNVRCLVLISKAAFEYSCSAHLKCAAAAISTFRLGLDHISLT